MGANELSKTSHKYAFEIACKPLKICTNRRAKTVLVRHSGRHVWSAAGARKLQRTPAAPCVKKSSFSAMIEFRYNRNLRQATAFVSRP